MNVLDAIEKDSEPLFVGAVKSNIGHTEGASGLAGIIKTVLALERGVIPPNTNFEALNPKIDNEYLRLAFPDKCIDWPSSSIRRASVNSFGFGGANAHVVLDDVQSYLQSMQVSLYPVVQPIFASAASTSSLAAGSTRDSSYIGPQLLVFSAHDKDGIPRQVQRHESYFQQFKEKVSIDFFQPYALALVKDRTVHAWKSFCVVDSRDQLDHLSTTLSEGVTSDTSPGNLGFLFTGQGAQWHGMGQELLDNLIFRRSIDRSQDFLTKLKCDWSIIDRLTDSSYAQCIGQALFSQALTTSIQLATFDLCIFLGIRPTVVLGHSSGEIAAAYAAGYLSHESAIRVSYYRGLLSSELETRKGPQYGMAALGLSSHDVEVELERISDNNTATSHSLVVSCINSPSSVTVSGEISELDGLRTQLQSRDIFARKLQVNLGYHSPQMSAIADEYLRSLGSLDSVPISNDQKPVMVSSVSGKVVDRETVCDGRYWVKNMVSTVNFLDAVQYCHQSRSDTKQLDASINHVQIDGWLEIGPHSALQGPVREIWKSVSQSKKRQYTSALVRHQSAFSSLLTAIGYLWCHGFQVHLEKAVCLGSKRDQKQSRRPVPKLPFYAFNHTTRHWKDSPEDAAFRFRAHGHHELLGIRTGQPNPFEAEWRFIIKEDEIPWVTDHKVNGVVLYPAAGMLTMVIEAARQMSKTSLAAFQLKSVSIPKPIILSGAEEGTEVRTFLSLAQDEGIECYDFRILSQNLVQGGHEVVCQGHIRLLSERDISAVDDGRHQREKQADTTSEFNYMRASCRRTMQEEALYRSFRDEKGLEYGPDFQALRNIRYDRVGHALATLKPYHPPPGSSPHVVHPTRLDCILQLCFVAMNENNNQCTMVPIGFESLWISASGVGHASEFHKKECVLTKTRNISRRNAYFDIKVVDEDSISLKVEMANVKLTSIADGGEERKTLAEAQYRCGHMKWGVDLSLLDSQEISQYCEEARIPRPAPVKQSQNLTTLALLYSAHALGDIDENHVIPSMKKYVAWMHKHIDAASLLPPFNSETLDELTASVLPLQSPNSSFS